MDTGELDGFGELTPEESERINGYRNEENAFGEDPDDTLEHQQQNERGSDGSEENDEHEEDDEIELDENGEPIEKATPAAAAQKNEDDEDKLTAEDIEKEVFGDSPAAASAGLMDQLKEFVPEEFLGGEALTPEKLVSFVKNLSTSTEEDEEISQFKKYKALNPESNIYEYKEATGGVFASALALDDRTLYVEWLKNAKKETDEQARETAEEAVRDGAIKEKADAIRAKLRENQAAAKKEFDDSLEKEKTKRNGIALENQKKMLTSMSENRSMFGGMFKASKQETIETIRFVKNGGLETAIKDPAQAAELAFYLKNKDNILKVLRSNMFEEGKALVLEKLNLTNKSKTTNRQPNKRDEGIGSW